MLLHDKTTEAMRAYIQAPAHALGIVGEPGIGKSFIAMDIARQLLGVTETQLQSHPYMLRVAPNEKSVIDIEQARQVLAFLRLKTTGLTKIRRIVMIEHAGQLTVQAQNTLLKGIEEPPEDTVIILTIDDKASILPTILSRIQLLQIHVPATNQTRAWYRDVDSGKLDTAIRLSGGRPGLLHALLENDTTHPLAQTIAEAKRLLASSTFDRLLAIDEITKQKKTMEIIQAMTQIASAGITASATDSDKTQALQKWTNILSACHTAHDYTRRNGQPKLVLTNLFLQL